MAVGKRNILGDPGDGSYQTAPSSAPLSTAGAFDSGQRGADDVAAYRGGVQRYSNVPSDSNDQAGGVGPEGDSGLSTTGNAVGEEFGTTTGGSDSLVTRPGGDSGDAFGKAVG